MGQSLIGPDVLGKFFREARGLSRAEIQDRAKLHFGKFANAVRPILEFQGHQLQGTISDRQFYVCRASSGGFWGLIVFLRTAHLMHTVLLPSGGSPDEIATYLDFLRNDNETIHVAIGQFNADDDQFEISSNAVRMRWPKTAGPFDPINRSELLGGGGGSKGHPSTPTRFGDSG